MLAGFINLFVQVGALGNFVIGILGISFLRGWKDRKALAKLDKHLDSVAEEIATNEQDNYPETSHVDLLRKAYNAFESGSDTLGINTEEFAGDYEQKNPTTMLRNATNFYVTSAAVLGI